jgi:(p)ppGpp synthase/HD superfamily hydrolase
MISTPRIEQAKELATRLHVGQVRKDGVTPYVEHLFQVAETLSRYTEDEDVIIAGLMHDTLEDVPDYTYEQLIEDCGERVAGIVLGVTEEKFRGHKELPREERVKLFEEMLMRGVAQIEKAGEGAILVACADKIHNLQSMIEGVEKHGKEYLERFNNPMEQKLWFYCKILEMAKRNSASPIVEEFEVVLVKAEEVLVSAI